MISDIECSSDVCAGLVGLDAAQSIYAGAAAEYRELAAE
jgi:hypothetical protein